MIEILEALKNYNGLTVPQKAEFLGLIAAPEILQIYTLLGRNADNRTLLRLLTDAAKKKPAAETLYSLEMKEGRIRAFLNDADPKTRKNAAALIGACCAREYARALLDALSNEETEFVRPSILLALGKTGDEKALEYLQAYTVKSEVEKHREEEKAALHKALSALNSGKGELRVPDINGFPIILTCPPGHADLTMEELDEGGKEYKNFAGIPDSLLLYPGRYEETFAYRTFYEALVYLGKCRNALAALQSFLENPKFAESIFTLYGEEEIFYRIEVKGVDHALRKEAIEAAVRAIGHPKLVNSPSNYSFELRLEVGKEFILLFAKPSQQLDKRFDYRLASLPASINPVTAAALMRYVYPYLKRDAEVADPFCGSGTLLFERARAKPYKTLTGIDIQKYAISCALKNEEAARTHARFVCKDILDFIPKVQYDEVLSNMPFGHRVGTHESNEALYRGFARKLSGLLKPRGMAFLYTNDKKLFADTIGKEKVFSIVDETVFASGQMHPSLFILLKNE